MIASSWRPNVSYLLLTAVALLSASIFSNAALAKDAAELKYIFSSMNAYFERPEYFSELPFEIGDYLTLKVGDDETFEPLYLPAHKGLPRLGLPLSYPKTESGADFNTVNPVVQRFQNDVMIYENLLLLDVMADYATTENLKMDNSGRPDNEAKNPRDIYSYFSKEKKYTYVPRYHIQSLAAGLLSPNIYDQYFCESEACSLNSFNRPADLWGGRSNEFKARRAYHGFVDNEVPKLKAAAKKLKSRFYMVGSLHLGAGKYDFERQGFPLKVYQPRSRMLYKPREGSTRVFTEANEKGVPAFFAIEESKAEAFLQQHPNIYYVVEAELYDAAIAPISSLRYSQTYAGISSAYDVTGTTIEFYLDELLTKPLFSIPIK